MPAETPAEIAALALQIRALSPRTRLRLSIKLIESAREAARSGDDGEAGNRLRVAAMIARTVCDEITALDAAGKLG